MFLIFFIYLMILSLNLFMLSMFFILMKKVIFMEWLLTNLNSISFSYSILLDWMSLLFMSIVLIISSFIMMYSMNYTKSMKFKNRFLMLMLLFILSMMLMILSPNILSLILGWDGLGLTSYCLVIFYQNNLSNNAGMLTILLNRIGDISIMMIISLFMMNGYFNIIMNNKMKFLILIFIMMASMTKSAQLPFSSWLPAAMAAPTPTSALVHSSTLVTGGIYLLIRYYMFLNKFNMNYLILIISSLTMFMSGLMANLEMDLKKIVALSTLSQLSLMMSILFLNLKNLAFFHLIIHALFKSLLFMTMGIFIHLILDNQDLRLSGNMINYSPLNSSIFLTAKLCLCGFPFLSGFFSKDMIMEMLFMMKINFMNLMLLIFSTIFTVSYSTRMIYFMLIMKFNFFPLNKFHNDWLMNYSMMMLNIFSIFSGNVFNSLIIKLNLNIIILNFIMKTLILYLCLTGIIMGILMFKFNFILNKFLMSMWFLNFIFKFLYFPIMKSLFKVFMNLEKGWFEEYNFLNLMSLIKKMNMKFKFLFVINNLLKIMVIFIFIYLMI